MPIFHKNRQNLQTAKTAKSQQILQDQITENHSIFCQNLENAVEPKTKKSAFFATKKSTPINKKHQQKNLAPTQATTLAPRKKFLKIFAAASLALITCATTLLATAPFGTSTAAAETNLSDNTQTTSPLGLDPENDPVVYTTSYGLQIRSHIASGIATETVRQPDGSSTSTSLKDYKYITAGGYNWVIIGQYSTTAYTFTSTLPGNKFSQLESDGTPAGSAISSDSNRSNSAVQLTVTIPTFTNAIVPENGEIPIGCVLCLCESYIPNSITFGSAADYVGSTQQTYMNDTIYGGDSALSKGLQALPIEPQTLKTDYNGGVSTIENAYIFPLASHTTTESFYVATYLTTAASRDIDVTWWTRSGFSASGYSQGGQINKDGAISNTPYHGSWGGYPRPAFILRLYGI